MDLLKIAPLDWCWRKIKTQYQGCLAALVIFILIALVYFTYLKSGIDRYINWGQEIGEYRIEKGERKTVVQWDLYITFNEQVYYHVSEKDSIFCYPSININGVAATYGLVQGDTKNKFPLGEPLIVDGKDFTYSIKMDKLEDSGRDTIAYFEVRRKSR